MEGVIEGGETINSKGLAQVNGFDQDFLLYQTGVATRRDRASLTERSAWSVCYCGRAFLKSWLSPTAFGNQTISSKKHDFMLS
jgi:hypothetical protein